MTLVWTWEECVLALKILHCIALLQQPGTKDGTKPQGEGAEGGSGGGGLDFVAPNPLNYKEVPHLLIPQDLLEGFFA